MDEKLTNIQIAVDQLGDYFLSKLQQMKAYLEEDDAESAAGILDSLIEELEADSE